MPALKVGARSMNMQTGLWYLGSDTNVLHAN